MAGIYIHIPFCRKSCNYCDFHFSTSLKYKSDLLDCIVQELISRKEEWSSVPIKTIYFGGGTPSLLGYDEIMKLVDKLQEVARLDELTEFTFEANPDDLTKQYVTDLSRSPINRLSIGVQSFFDADLKFMNRIHTAEQAMQSIKHAQNAGFESISIDLIYGSPTTSMVMWQENLQHWNELPCSHLSTYCLTVEPKTALYHQIESKKIPPLDEDKSVEQFQALQQFSIDNQLNHYELSNLSIPGQEAIHNSAYWIGEPYFGIGPSAHSYDGQQQRRINIANNVNYIKAIQEGSQYFELEQLSKEEQYNEYLITRLRTKNGISREEFVPKFGEQSWLELLSTASKLLDQNKLSQKQDRLSIPSAHWFITDSILIDLIQ